jgi:amino acid transporter
VFDAPTYSFIASIGLLLLVGCWRAVTGEMAARAPLASGEAGIGISGFLLLRAFANGCTAMTGVEAISNGIPAFEPPEPDNAAATLVAMAGILVTMFVGINFLAVGLRVMPHESETVLSQLGRAVFGGRSAPYYFLQITTTAILILAANTSYADFPRLVAILARDRFAPARFARRSDRLTFSNGIGLLTLLSVTLIVAAGGRELGLIPLYAIGVFLSFTLSQAGMVRHWWQHPVRGWKWRAAMNAAGAMATTVVLVVFTVTKFRDGAWVVVILIPAGVWVLLTVSRHYSTGPP